MSTVEELNVLIAAERTRNETELQSLRRQREGMASVLEEQTQIFMELITRVTELRVAKGEHMAAEVEGRTTEEKFDTGNQTVDTILYDIQSKLQTSSSVGGTLLDKLETAARAAVTPHTVEKPSTLVTTDSKATRVSSFGFVTRNEIRGMRPWAAKHVKSCSACKTHAQNAPGWSKPVDEKLVGMEAVPDISKIPGKTLNHFHVTLKKEKSLSERVDDRTVEFARFTGYFEVCGADKSPLANPAETAAKTEVVLNGIIEEVMERLKKESADAPWNKEASRNTELSVAVDVLLHSITTVLHVSVANPSVVAITPNCSVFCINGAVTLPVHVSAFYPMFNIISDPAQRKYVNNNIIKPLAKAVGDIVGMPELVVQYTTIGIEVLDALYRLGTRYGLLDGDKKEASPKTKAPAPVAKPAASPSSALFDRLFNILHTLVVFGSYIDIKAAMPKIGEVSDAESAKKAGGLALTSFLRQFTAPKPYQFPSVSDPAISDIVVQVCRAPTTFLEILNRTFSSNRRLPSTSRTTAVDFVVSPRSKISLGLKLFSEIVVDVYRPYTPGCGVVIYDEDGKGGKPKAPACVPRADLPVDLVKASIAVDEKMTEVLKKVSEWTAHGQGMTDVEKEGREIVDKVAEKVAGDADLVNAREKLMSIGVYVEEIVQTASEILLPFDFTSFDISESTRPLLYLSVNARRHF